AFAAEATSRGASVLIGRCDELGRDLPLQPVLDALQAPTVAAPPELSLVTTVPDVGAGRQLLFGSLLDLVARLAADRVLVLVVEDLHHAGGATVEWLQMAIRRPGRLLVLGTRRPEG